MRLGADERGQAIQVGAIILFGFVVIAFAGYQAVSVPDQNQEVEFRHSMQVTDQMQEFRADVVEAASTGSTRSQAFKLGTEYPARAFAVNPAPASGQLSTKSFAGGEYVLDAPGASLEDICGLTDGTGNSVDSKALVYEPNYNVYTQAPDVVYENTVTYRQFPGDVRLDSGQNLVDGKTLTLTPLVGDVSESTSATRTVDLAPGKAGIGSTNADSDVTYTLTVPTALSADVWENELLADEVQVEGVTDAASGGVEIELAPGEYTVVCPPVGLGSAPDNDPADELSRNGDGSADLNPGGPGEVQLTGISTSGPNDEVALTFTNSGETVDLSAARYNFYFGGTSGGGTAPESLDILDESGTTIVSSVQLRGETKSAENDLQFDGEGADTTATVDFSEDYKDGDFFVIRLRFSDGQDSLYFVDIEDETDGSTEGGTNDVSSGSVSDLSGTSSQTQTLEFTVGNTLQSGDEVEIDLSNAQSNGNNGIDYGSASATSTSGQDVSFTQQSNSNAVLTYTADGSESTGDTVSITVSSVDPGSNSVENDFTVTFAGPDGVEASDSFTVNP